MPRQAQRSPFLEQLRRVLDHVVSRVVLSLAIIVSLLPHPWIRTHDVWFLLVFAPEFLIRALLLFRAEWQEDSSSHEPDWDENWRWPWSGAIGLLLLDLVAMLSFIPVASASQMTTRWLRVFRLARMLLLLRYWAPLARDLWAVMVRAERGRQVGLMGLVVLVLSFAGAVILDNMMGPSSRVDFDGDENFGDPDDRSFFVRLWWAFRQIQDPGNMLSSPDEWTALIVSLGLTVFGLFLVSFLIGLGTDVVHELMELSRLRPPGLHGHTVVVNIGPSTRPLLTELMRHYRKLIPTGLRVFSRRWFTELVQNARWGPRYVVVGRSEEPPDFLRDSRLARVVYRRASPDDEKALLDRADIHSARRVVLLADLHTSERESDELLDIDPDDETIRTMLTIVEQMQLDPNPDQVVQTRLIAEILDESNVPAAQRAIASARRRAGLGDGTRSPVDAYVVPTERLLALFIACVSRRPSSSWLLLELLTSKGHEIYTFDYDRPGEDLPLPALPEDPHEAVERLFHRGVNRPVHERVVPVGLLIDEAEPDTASISLEGDALESPVGLTINPRPGQPRRGRVRGLAAIAPNFRVVAEFCQELSGAPEVPLRRSAFPRDLAFRRDEGDTRLERALICGFRPASVNLVESLVLASPGLDITILCTSRKGAQEALDDFHSHTNLVRNGMLRGRIGLFEQVEDELACGGADTRDRAVACLRYRRDATEAPCPGRIRIYVGNWASSRQLMDLPGPWKSVNQVDVVVLLSSEHSGSDARTTTALMKIEALQEHGIGTESGRAPRIVAEVLDAELADRLRRRYAKLELEVQVFSIQRLRAFFMFQSVVVPHFELVYGELMAPWGESLVPLEFDGEHEGVCSFEQLAARLRTDGKILVGWEPRTLARPGTLGYVAEGDPQRAQLVDLRQVRRLWVITRDRPQQLTIRGDEPSPTDPEPANHVVSAI